MEKLYTLAYTKDPAKQDLYLKRIDNTLDYFTYFNSFSLAKWCQYTTLCKVALRLLLKGFWKITWEMADKDGLHILLEEENCHEDYEYIFDTKTIHAQVIGFQLQPLTEGAEVLEGAWYGEFDAWQLKNIGISITTFKRERYVQRNIVLLKEFQKNNPWLMVQVIDNGNTLPEEESKRFRLLHNPNYGGSGGFTRGIIEYVERGEADYILLMDDDVVLDPTALERSYALLCGLQQKYKDSFLAGAMLRVEEPTIQHENTAYWDRIVSKPLFQGLNLADKKNLANNGILPNYVNMYAGWWYCCIPVRRIKEIGYPLPNFIKSDDMEYGIRNKKELLCLNGIAVWHEAFKKKLNDVMRFYSDRNTFIQNHYVSDCNRRTLLVSIMARLGKRILKGDFSKITVLKLALEEYEKGYAQLTAISGDAYFKMMQEKTQRALDLKVILGLVREIVRVIANYHQVHEEYRLFRENELSTEKFWKQYLHLNYENKQ